MPRRKQINPSVGKHLKLPAELVLEVELQLFSELEGRVPFGAWQRLITRLLQEHLQQSRQAEQLRGQFYKESV